MSKKILAVIAFLLITGGLISTQTTLKNPNSCNSSDYYARFLKDDFGSKINLQKSESKKSPGFVIWKRASNEPFISYPAKAMMRLYWGSKLPVSNIDKLYRANVDSKFKSTGLQALDDSPSNPSYAPPRYFYSYKDGKILINITITGKDKNSYISYTDNSVVINCGVIDPKYDALYTDLFSKPTIRDFVGSKIVKDRTFKEIIESEERGVGLLIFEVHQNNILKTSIGWLHKETDMWSRIDSGLQTPSCAQLENAGIEAGISCYDQGVSKGIFIRKTK